MVPGQDRIHYRDTAYSVIKDDAIPELLLSVKRPTFVTINYKDFWRKPPLIAIIA
jgi:hypothetical protein